MTDIQSFFIFRTRTFEKDYIVLSGLNDGEAAGIKEEKFFDDIFRAAGINGTEEPAAGLCNFEKKCCVFAVGLQTGNNDKAGRPIRFSFCCIFSKNEKNFALKTINNIVNKWEDAEKKLNLFINQDLYKTNEIKFNHEKFIKWLNDDLSENKVKLTEFPAKNHFFKWEKNTNNFINNAPLKNIKKRSCIFYCIIALMLIFFLFAKDIKNIFSAKKSEQQITFVYNAAKTKIRNVLENLDERSDEIQDEFFKTNIEYNEIKFNYSILQKKDMAEITQNEADEMHRLKISGDVLTKRLQKLSEDKNVINAKKTSFLSASGDIAAAYKNGDLEMLQKLSEKFFTEIKK